ncbi:hypothetical protein A6R68_16005 [Neotoma lepida]|uniref:Uncharacterized protein n=1 Tax=Neotoma lepida TaxID=56216 RepID=A0A1A6H773_NEOLE|nr:hypothetical protein A6R68_16005 [Neotoma lepida]
MGQFGSKMNMGRTNEILSNELKRGELTAKQGGGGAGGSVPGIKRMGLGIDCNGSAGMERMGTGLGHGMDQMKLIECMGSGTEYMDSGTECMDPLGLDHMASSM